MQFIKKFMTKKVAIGLLAVALAAGSINPKWAEPIVLFGSAVVDLYNAGEPVQVKDAE